MPVNNPTQPSFIQTKALWTWDTTTNPSNPTVISYPSGYPTKSGIMPNDLKMYVGVPFTQVGITNLTQIPDNIVIKWIRWAEDWIEQTTSVLLTQTWLAAPPGQNALQLSGMGITPVSGKSSQILGIDYDMYDAPYDFLFERAQDEGWLYQQLRYAPLRPIINPDGSFAPTCMINYSMIYPLLSEFFKIPPTWFVEDQDFALLRIVPAANVQMLPLFAMQLAFMGFAESIPGGLWFQYTAGLTNYDYHTRFSFMKEFVMTQAAIVALQSLQGSINLGLNEMSTDVDGLRTTMRYNPSGPYAGLIKQFEKRRDEYQLIAKQNIGGPQIIGY